MSNESFTYNRQLLIDSEDDAETASQLSISLSSAPSSPFRSNEVRLGKEPTHPELLPKHSSIPLSLNTDASSETDEKSMYTDDADQLPESPPTSSILDIQKTPNLPTYPPTSKEMRRDSESNASFASENSFTKKARPESLLPVSKGPLVLGMALVDFNHLAGPVVEYSKGDILEDEEIKNILPFLALPDGAHLQAEDYSYFHLVQSSPAPTTIFGISCNQQISASALLVKDADVTRSTVQKAVVVLVSKPLFGPIRDKLGVVTTALFQQRDFRETAILDDFATTLEPALRSQLTESGLYMGTNLRELVHTFRQKILILVKALILQKRIMFFGHPVERLCTYQYSLVSLLPGLLQTLDDCGSPPLASRAPTLSQPTSLRTSDRKSMMAYMGLPLDTFGEGAFFQPYLPLQQLDLIRETQSWLCGTTNSIVMQQKEIDLLVNTETGTLEFRDPMLERSAGLTAADRKWMDDIVKDVNESYDKSNSVRAKGIYFKGSDDYLRLKFEDYTQAALASVRYRDFLSKGESGGVLVTGGIGGSANSSGDFNPLWIAEFKKTNAYQVWERTTDPMLFDIIEPRHPCTEKPSVVADIGLRLQEGIQDLKLEQQLAPTREAISRTLTAGSTGFFKAVEGVRGRWQRTAGPNSASAVETIGSADPASTSPVEITKSEADEKETLATVAATPLQTQSSRDSFSSLTPVAPAARLASWGAGIGSFISTRAARFSTVPKVDAPVETPVTPSAPTLPLEPSQAGARAASPSSEPIKTPLAERPRAQLRSLSLLNASTPSALSSTSVNVVDSPRDSPVGESFPARELPPRDSVKEFQTRALHRSLSPRDFPPRSPPPPVPPIPRSTSDGPSPTLTGSKSQLRTFTLKTDASASRSPATPSPIRTHHTETGQSHNTVVESPVEDTRSESPVNDASG